MGTEVGSGLVFPLGCQVEVEHLVAVRLVRVNALVGWKEHISYLRAWLLAADIEPYEGLFCEGTDPDRLVVFVQPAEAERLVEWLQGQLGVEVEVGA